MPETVADPKADKPLETSTPPAADTPAAPAGETAPTPEQMAEKTKTFAENFLGTPVRQKPTKPKFKPAISPDQPAAEAPKEEPPNEEKKDEPAGPPKEEPKTDPLPAPEPEPKTPVVVPIPIPKSDATPPDEPIDDQARIDAEVARRMAERDRQQPQSPEAPVQPKVDHALEVISAMEQLQPGKYDGLTERTKEFRPLEAEYRRKWRIENPDRKFNPEDQEHDEWYSQNQPPINQDDFRMAERHLERKLIKAEVERDVLEKIEPELQQTRFHRAIQEARPHIERAANEAMASVLSAVPEFEKAMNNGKGAYVLSQDSEKRMEDANPVLYALAQEQSDHVTAVVVELEKMDRLGAHYRMNPGMTVPLPSGDIIRPHAVIGDTLVEVEDTILNAPAKERVRNGKTFLTLQERGERVADIQKSKLTPAQKQERLAALEKAHWSVGAKEIKDRIITRSRNKLEQLAKKMPAAPTKPKEPSSQRNGEHGKPATPPKATEKPAPRSGSDTATSSDTIDSRPAGVKNEPTGANTVLNKWFGS